MPESGIHPPLHDLLRTLDLQEEPRRVLIVEDHVALATRLRRWLEDSGHAVVVMLGVDEVVGSVAYGTALDDGPNSYNLEGCDCVFLDHFFLSRRLNGALFMLELRRFGIGRVLAMSSDRSANRAMVEAGALCHVAKSQLISMLG